MSAIEDLADRLGVVRLWHDLAGTPRRAAPETLRALVAAMGVPAGSEAEAAEALAALGAEDAARRTAREWIVAPGEPVWPPADWEAEIEDGSAQGGRAHAPFHPPAGVHRLRFGGETALVIAAPPRLPPPPRGWGVTLPLWGLRSPGNLGAGNLADLAAAAAALGHLGADFAGINPIHARGSGTTDPSPYAPTSRVALDPALIALDAVPGADAARPVLARHADALAAAREGPLADPALRDLVLGQALRAIFDATGPAVPLSPAVARFARFEALAQRHGPDWRAWPAALRDPTSPAVADRAHETEDLCRFFVWQQGLASEQLAVAQRSARAAGMRIGLYLDIAVGVRPGGADVWAEPAAYAHGVSLGAPPDRFAPEGQRWNLAPFAPHGLRALAYEPFRAMLRAAMSHAGMVRIDHILGFRRAYWLPDDGTPGSYVEYPQDVLLALTRLEAQRARCVVVGEDLGTVPAGLREAMAGSGILGCAVAQFERRDGVFAAPRTWRRETLGSLATHDTPTVRGWWLARDIDHRAAIGNPPPAPATLAGWRAHRAAERETLAAMLAAEGLPATTPDEAAASLDRALAAAGSVLVAVQLDDALGAVEQQNLPGTVDEHPNWRRRLDADVDAMAEDGRLRAVAAVMNAVRGRSGAGGKEGA
jgi:4-alpha-glucanotransferase